MEGLKNIIFDLGGVLLNIDYNRTFAAAEQLGVKNFKEMYSQSAVNELFAMLETGKVSEQDFYKSLKKHIPHPISNKEIADAWNAMLLDFRLKSLDFVDYLSSRYKLYLLSNTNSIHSKCFHEKLLRQTGLPSLDRYFTKSYYSHHIGLRKPGREIYLHVLEDAQLEAGETLFIDDTKENIQTAIEMGIKTVLLGPGEKIEDLSGLKT